MQRGIEYVPVLAVLYGAALYGLGEGGRKLLDRNGLGGPMRATGVILGLIGLLVFSFRVTFGGLSEERASVHDPLVERFIILFVIASVFGIVLLALDYRKVGRLFEALGVAAATALPLLVLYRPAEERLNVFDYRSTSIRYALTANALTVLVALGAILAGYRRNQLWLARTGITFAVIELAFRFVDLEWSRRSRSLVIICAGISLLALSYLFERRRVEP